MSLNQAALMSGRSRDALTRMCDARPTKLTHRAVEGPVRRRIYIPLIEVERLKGEIHERKKSPIDVIKGKAEPAKPSKSAAASLQSPSSSAGSAP